MTMLQNSARVQRAGTLADVVGSLEAEISRTANDEAGVLQLGPFSADFIGLLDLFDSFLLFCNHILRQWRVGQRRCHLLPIG
jgi:hypothetical protein